MLKVDAHHHLWKFNPQEYPWLTENLSVIQNDYFPSDLKPELDKVGIQFSVAVEARLSLFETTFLLEQAAINPFIAGVVGWLDLTSGDLEEHLIWFRRFKKLVGVRHRFNEDSFDLDILNPKIKESISLLSKYGLTYDILCVEKNLPAVIKFTDQFSDQKMVLDHIAKPLIKSGTLKPWEDHIRILAQNENVHCKISGLVTEANWKNWKEDDLKPYLDVVFEAFGTDRLLFGSDWPVCLLAASYEKVHNVIHHYLEQFSYEEQQKIWGLNAINFYNLKINNGSES